MIFFLEYDECLRTANNFILIVPSDNTHTPVFKQSFVEWILLPFSRKADSYWSSRIPEVETSSTDFGPSEEILHEDGKRIKSPAG
jgi:hypothetical protein